MLSQTEVDELYAHLTEYRKEKDIKFIHPWDVIASKVIELDIVHMDSLGQLSVVKTRSVKHRHNTRGNQVMGKNKQVEHLQLSDELRRDIISLHRNTLQIEYDGRLNSRYMLNGNGPQRDKPYVNQTTTNGLFNDRESFSDRMNRIQPRICKLFINLTNKGSNNVH